jgi:hypothetical protein
MWKISPQTSPEARSTVRQIERQARYFALMGGEPYISPEQKGLGNKGKPIQPTAVERSPLELLAATDGNIGVSIPSVFSDPLEMLNITIGSHSQGLDTPRKRSRCDATREQGQRPKPRAIHLVDVTSSESRLSTDRTFQQAQVRDAESINNSTSCMPPLVPSNGSGQTNTTIPSALLLEKTYSLIYRPLYPLPKRPRNRPSVRSVLPAARLVNTFDALLAAVGWAHRDTPVSSDVKCGIIFVEPYDADRVVEDLETYKRRLGTRLEELPGILVVRKIYLDIYVESSESMDLEVLWKSH